MPNAITRVMTWLCGDYVGEDGFGNLYYQTKKTPATGRRRRWVIYKHSGPKVGPGAQDDASRVPPMYNGWLHYTVKDFPEAGADKRYAWQKDHVPNLTGTPDAYRPPGHTLRGGHRDRATGDYEAWTPE
jgi:NADH:ubiquinone oxidoreductase subunit